MGKGLERALVAALALATPAVAPAAPSDGKAEVVTADTRAALGVVDAGVSGDLEVKNTTFDWMLNTPEGNPNEDMSTARALALIDDGFVKELFERFNSNASHKEFLETATIDAEKSPLGFKKMQGDPGLELTKGDYTGMIVKIAGQTSVVVSKIMPNGEKHEVLVITSTETGRHIAVSKYSPDHTIKYTVDINHFYESNRNANWNWQRKDVKPYNIDTSPYSLVAHHYLDTNQDGVFDTAHISFGKQGTTQTTTYKSEGNSWVTE